MTTAPYRPLGHEGAESDTPTQPGQVEILGGEPGWGADESTARLRLASAWLRLGPRVRAVTTGVAVLLGLAALTVVAAPGPPVGQPAGTSVAPSTSLGATDEQGAGDLGALRAAAVASWLEAQHTWADGQLATLCRSFTGIGAVDATPRGQAACKRLFSPSTGALLGLAHVDRPRPGVRYRADDAFVLSDRRTVLVYGRRVRTGTGRVLDPESRVVYVMRSVPLYGWRWVGTTDAEASVGWVPPGFPPVRT